MKGRRVLLGVLILGLVAALSAGPTPLSVRASDTGRLRASFNADPYEDLAIGVPYENVGTIDNIDAGAVNVLYGTFLNGLSGAGDQFWHQDCPSVLDITATSDEFGSALAVGDFNGDGYADLAIGVPGQPEGGQPHAGAVHVLYGTWVGLDAMGNQIWSQATDGISGAPEANDHFGYAVAAGDFNGDGYDDLAIGVPQEEVGVLNNAGLVHVIYGSSGGLSSAGSQLWTQDSSGIDDACEPDDNFGSSLAAGDFNRDGRDDLAIGAPYETIGSSASAGAVNVIYGSDAGLTGAGDWFLHQDATGILGIAEPSDLFGWALAAGDMNGDGFTDLAIGAPGQDVGSASAAGVVHIVYGSRPRLSATGNQLWDQDSPGVDGEAEANDSLGRALITGDFNADGCDDLAIGVPFEDYGTTVDSGVVQVLYGSRPAGLTGAGSGYFFQGGTGMLDFSEASDVFGWALAAGDFSGNGFTDLAIGVPFEDVVLDGVGVINNAGAVQVLKGSPSGITTSGSQFWRQGVGGVEDALELSDQFGTALAALYRVKNDVIFVPLTLRNASS